ncbi:hypothetical protein ICM_02372 [Bacillus cereus BAG1X2-3]|nr:hypothetical protein ICC_02441 [Bacillus cereus BAG1X1-1]EOO48425.1 hypothetical protein ICI_02936 [Bacillus cereus BAG1X2-1]EOO52927.1 hypothetical protein ICK_02419 [Bacillus cereus BAG1X2-2]EOO59356.1 hypothetical protein ICM_02372 [Bacillus cereus BAG1X2-3]EOP05273.1 hypothetical protein ICO_02932 [Bacillus cereus BAG2O-1]
MIILQVQFVYIVNNVKAVEEESFQQLFLQKYKFQVINKIIEITKQAGLFF